MPKPRKLNLETSTARLKLKIQKKPYRLPSRAWPFIGYRRNEGPGTWSVIAADGRGQEWLKKIGVADDHDPANGKEILNYTQAVDTARQLTQGGGEVENASQPATLKGALAAYEADLTARGANTYNARWPLKYLPSLLLAKPITLIEANELRAGATACSRIMRPPPSTVWPARRSPRSIWRPRMIRASRAGNLGTSVCRACLTRRGRGISF